MKKNLIYYVLFFVCLTGCTNQTKYPEYKLTTMIYIPDTVKTEYKTWIQETTRAAHQHLSAGKYSDADAIVYSVKREADIIFGKKIECLEKSINDNFLDNIEIPPAEMTEKEKLIFKKLRAGK